MPHQDGAHSAWDLFVAGHEVGDVLIAPVTKAVPVGVFVRLSKTIEGLVHQDSLSGAPDVGDLLRVRIDEIDRTRRRVRLSAS
ncbi:RNA binding S1 domain protein [Catenulispora acidiphila DSM 44928]|uniref:RNA binding S1 domain protein n=1 Tax=Catenulispora acidiphila (strain DSM 44928 / JCM 14897 / NBRC 102108 / NRRL B-24433 / ID139908) TaxID=479433 RepID=C7PZB8_CATAD|nr:S1 RNA-binding domain-containing protein [Catenulispora acidiphila]ACU71575.1 RNA binding S1 domain protein [Catenulispora acidiphila DSM 44928]